MLQSTRGAMTLVEIMVSIAIFLMLITVVSMVHNNVGKSIERTLAMLQIHHEGTAISRQLREDFENLAPQVAMKQSDVHVTFMRTHGEALAQESRHAGVASGYYVHDLIWVRWYWKDGQLRRADSPRLPGGANWKGANNDDHENTMGGSLKSGAAPSPQRYYHYFQPEGLSIQPPAMPDDHRDTDYQTDIETLEASLREFGGYDISTDIYYRPAKLWWHPGHEKSHNRGEPGTAMKLYAGSITSETGSTSITTITKLTSKLSVAENDAKELSFSVVNGSGFTTNRDYMNLLGTHPENPYSSFPSRLGLVSSHVLNFRLHLFAHDWRRVMDTSGNPLYSDLEEDGTRKTTLFSFEEAADDYLGPDVHNGLPMGPSKEGRIDSDICKNRPVRAEVSFIVHNIPLDSVDEDDLDGDGDSQEQLARVLGELYADSDADLIDALEERGYIGVVFQQAINLPN